MLSARLHIRRGLAPGVATRLVAVASAAGLVTLAACSPAPAAPTTAPAAPTAPAAVPATAPAQPTAAAASKPAATAAAPAPAASGSRKILAATTTVGALQWPYYVAVDKGFFKEANIDIEITVADTNLKEVQGLLSGSLNIAGGSPDVLIKAVAQNNSDLVIVGSVTSRPVYTLVAQPDVKTFADLKGKRVGVSAELSMDGLWMKQLLEANGLKPGDAEIVEIGGTAARYQAMKAKGVAATLLTQPQDFQAMREGFVKIGSSTDIVKEIVWSGYNTTRAWAKNNEALMLDFLRVIRRAHQWLYDPKNKDEAIQILTKDSNTAPQDAADTYNLWVTGKTLSPNGDVSAPAVQTMIDALVATKQMEKAIPVERVLDTSYMDKVLKGS